MRISEIYRGAAAMPGELYDMDGCGVIAVWTRRESAVTDADADAGVARESASISRIVIAAGLVVGWVLLRRSF